MADQVDVKIQAQIGEFLAAMQQATEAMKQMSSRGQQHAKELQNAFEQMGDRVRDSLKDLVGGVSLALMAEKVKEITARQLEFAEQLEQTSHKIAMSTTELQELKFAGDLVGVSFSTITMAMRGMTMAMSAAESGDERLKAAFHQVGISVDELKSLSPQEILMRIADAFHENADGAGKMQEAIALFRRSGLELTPILNMGRQGLKEMSDAAHELGVIMSKDQVETMARTGIELKILHAQSEAMQRQFVSSLVPSIEKVIGALGTMNDKSGQAVTAGVIVGRMLTGLTAIIGVVWTALMDLGAAIGALGASFGALFSKMDLRLLAAGPAGAFAMVAKAAWQSKGEITEIWGGLKETFAANNAQLVNMFGQLGAEGEQAAGRLKTLAERVQELMKTGDANTLGRDSSVALQAAELDHQIRMMELAGAQKRAQLELDIAEHKVAADQKAAYEYEINSKVAEDVRKLMSAKLALYKDDSKGYLAEKQKMEEYDAKTAAERTKNVAAAVTEVEAAQKKKNAIIARDVDEQIRLVHEGQRIEEQYLSELVEDHKLAAGQKLAIERQMENDVYVAARAAAVSKLALYRADSAEYAAVERQIQNIDADHSLKLQKNSRETAKAVQESFKPVLDTITGAWDQMLSGVLHGTQTWQQAWFKAVSDMAVTFVVSLSKMALQWVAFKAGLATDPFLPFADAFKKVVSMFTAGETAMTAEKVAQTGEREAADAVATTESISESEASSAAEISAYAATAAVAAMASVAAIPFYGWAMAPEVGAATWADGLSYLAALDTGTNYVPRDMTARIHEGEAVVPKAYNPAAGGTGSGATVHFHVSAVDGQSVANMLRSQSDTIYHLISRATRDNHPMVRGQSSSGPRTL